jgi:hypothetical protein
MSSDEEANALPLDATQSEEPVQKCSNQQDTISDDDEMTIITRWNTRIFMTTIRMQQSSLGVARLECWTRNGTTPSQCIAERAATSSTGQLYPLCAPLSHSHGTLAHFCRYCIWRRGTHVEVK